MSNSVKSDHVLGILRACRLFSRPLIPIHVHTHSEQEWLTEAAIKYGKLKEIQISTDLAQEVLERDSTPLSSLFTLAQELVEFEENGPHCRDTFTWHHVVRFIDSDLLIAAALAQHGPPPEDKPELVRTLAWPSILRQRSFLVEDVLSREVTDCHVHLGGALPPSFYWLAAMCNYAHIYRLSEWETACLSDEQLWPCLVQQSINQRAELMHWAKLSVRVYETQTILGHGWVHKGSKNESLWEMEEAFPSEPFLDPILHALSPDANNRMYLNPVLGERYLLWKVLSLLFREQEKQPVLDHEHHFTMSKQQNPDRVFLEYLGVRNAFQFMLLHQDEFHGFFSFQKTFHRQHLLFNNHQAGNRMFKRKKRRARRMAMAIERFRVHHALRYQFSDPTDAPWARDHAISLPMKHIPTTPWRPPRQIEFRVTPVFSPIQGRVFHAYLKGVKDFVQFQRDASPLRVGFVFHLLKRKDYNWIEQVGKKQVEGLFHFLEMHERFRPFLVGFDAAGHEMVSPPRDFSSCFREIHSCTYNSRDKGQIPLHIKRTFHAGEDFRDLLTGLRVIDDAVHLLNLKPGDRIGHGFALGIDPAKWYAEFPRGRVKALDHLLDLLWAKGLADIIDPSIGIKPDMHTGYLIELRLKQFADWFTNEQTRVQCKSEDSKEFFKKKLLSWNGTWNDVGKYPNEKMLLEHFMLKDEVNSLKELLYSYVIDEYWIQIVKEIRNRVVQRVKKAEVILEFCPTSNLIIGGFRSYGDLPYTELNRVHLEQNTFRPSTPRITEEDPQIYICLNSDNPGIFQTTITNEYRLMGHGLLEAGYRRRSVNRWLEEARRIGVAACFIPPWSPPTREELLYALNYVDSILPPGTIH